MVAVIEPAAAPPCRGECGRPTALSSHCPERRRGSIAAAVGVAARWQCGAWGGRAASAAGESTGLRGAGIQAAEVVRHSGKLNEAPNEPKGCL